MKTNNHSNKMGPEFLSKIAEDAKKVMSQNLAQMNALIKQMPPEKQKLFRAFVEDAKKGDFNAVRKAIEKLIK